MQHRIVVLGAGGHARVVVEILEEMDRWSIVGCLCPEAGISDLLGYPILGGDECLPQIARSGVRSAVVALGDNRLRRRLGRWVEENGLDLATVVSPRATLSRRATLGNGVVVAPGAVVNTGAVIGDGVIINTGATVDHDCVIGAYAHIAPGSHLAGNVQIGEGALVGIGACVLPGVRIGAWATVGAGAAVHREVADETTVVGVPAKRQVRKGAVRAR